MPMVLGAVLDHPSLAPAEPTLLTREAHADRTVRWVHSSEVLEIAPLLRGGELLLTGGSVLSYVSAERQRAYIRGLAAHGVTAVAIETTGEGAGLPDALVDEAQKQDFALIQLARTAPFVEITEEINGRLVNDSVRRLRLADSLSDSLSEQLTSGAEPQQLADTLAAVTGATVTVRDTAGEPVATAAQEMIAPDAVAASATPAVSAECVRHAAIAVHGVTTALLELVPPAEADDALIEAALDRAPQAFGLALLRSVPPTPAARTARALFRALREPGGQELAPLIEASGLASSDTFVAVTAVDSTPTFRGVLEQAMRRGGRNVLSHVDDHEFLALVILDRDRPESSRQSLVDDIQQVGDLLLERPTIGVGPPAGSARLAHSVIEARRCLAPSMRSHAVDGVVDARRCGLPRLVHRLDADDALDAFVAEQLGAVLELPWEVRARLLHTLEVFFDCAANKTETARRLHLRRQTLYQRLDKLSRVLGREVTDPATLADLQVAARIHQVLESRQPG